MQVFLFRSSADPQLLGLTNVQDGSNLPAELAPWHASGSQMIPAGASPTDPLIKALTAAGFLIARGRGAVRSAILQ